MYNRSTAKPSDHTKTDSPYLYTLLHCIFMFPSLHCITGYKLSIFQQMHIQYIMYVATYACVIVYLTSGLSVHATECL